MASTVNGYNNYNIEKKFYSNSIQSDSTEMTEEDEDFNTFTNSSSFQTSTTNSSPINVKLASEEMLLNQSFYSAPTLANTQLNGKNHSNHIRRSIIQSPSMKNFNKDLYFNTNFNNQSITTIQESSPEPAITMETPTRAFGMTSSPSMRALENILNEKTRSNNTASTLFETIKESDDDDEKEIPLQAPLIPNRIHNNQSELSVATFHTAKSGAVSVDDDTSEREKLINDDNDYDGNNEDEMNELHGLHSPGLNNDPVKKLGLLSPNVFGRNFQVPDKVDHENHEYRSMIISDDDTTHLNQKTAINSPAQQDSNIETSMKKDTFTTAREEVDDIKKNRRKSFAGFFKGKKFGSSNDLLLPQQQQQQQQRPKATESKSASSVPLYKNNHVKSKSYSNFEVLAKNNEDTNTTRHQTQESVPRSKSKFFSAFKRRSAYAVQQHDEPKQEEISKSKTAVPAPTSTAAKSALRNKASLETLKDENVIKEAQLVKGHSKRNSILVPSPVLDNHSFEKVSKPTLFNDLSFSESMVSSINHNYDILNNSDKEDNPKEEDNDQEDGYDDEDEFNSSFNSINKSYSNDESPVPKASALLPRDISVGSLRMNFDDFNIDNYGIEDYEELSTVPTIRSNIPAQRAQHHKASSKIQNLLGEALFPKSLDINEVASITTLERSRSLRSVRSTNANSARESFDGMTVVQSPNSPIHEPMNSTLLSSPSSILKRRSMDYDDDLQEFAKMIDFGDDDGSDNDDKDFSISIDMNLSDYDYANYDPEYKQDTLLPPKSLKPLPSVPSNDSYEDEEEEGFDILKKEEDEEEDIHQILKKEENDDKISQNPFDYPYIKQEVKKEDEIEFEFDDSGNYIKQESEETEEEDTFEKHMIKNEPYDDDNFSVKIKHEEDFGEDFNDYNYDYHHGADVSPQSEKSPIFTHDAYMPTLDEMEDPQRPVSLSFRGLKGPKFGETNKLVPSSSNSHSLYMTLPHDDSSQMIQSSPSRLNLKLQNYHLYNNTATTTKVKKVSFSSRIVLFDTYHEEEYDRHPEIATCNQLTPLLAQRIKEELNEIKNEMEVHDSSKCYTQFF